MEAFSFLFLSFLSLSLSSFRFLSFFSLEEYRKAPRDAVCRIRVCGPQTADLIDGWVVIMRFCNTVDQTLQITGISIIRFEGVVWLVYIYIYIYKCLCRIHSFAVANRQDKITPCEIFPSCRLNLTLCADQFQFPFGSSFQEFGQRRSFCYSAVIGKAF